MTCQITGANIPDVGGEGKMSAELERKMRAAAEACATQKKMSGDFLDEDKRDGFILGAHWLLQALASMGAQSFDEKAAEAELQRQPLFEFSAAPGEHRRVLDETARILQHMLRWQHSQTAAILAAKDEALKERDAIRDELAAAKARIAELESLIADEKFQRAHEKISEMEGGERG